MAYRLMGLIVLELVGMSLQYCYTGLSDKDYCTTKSGQTLSAGSKDVKFAADCESCSCTARNGTSMLTLQCCAYGIHAGVFLPPPGCKMTEGPDGCSAVLVKIYDETEPC